MSYRQRQTPAACSTAASSSAAGQKLRQQQQQSAGSASTSSGVSSSNSSSYCDAQRPAHRDGKVATAAATSSANGNGCPASANGDDNYFSSGTMRSLQEAFNFFDIDQDGRITSGELQKVLKFLGFKTNEDEVKLMIADVDIDGNGTVEFNEFLKMMKKYYKQSSDEHSEDADMWEAFKAFDHNGDNFIDFAEIKKTMHFLGEEVTDEDVRSMIREADVDNDGRINFEEFKKMMAVMQQKASSQS
ncbi:hypothetical protein BOX15_Mlig001031g1 [Macrostomum lignano]|uniref:EF-hand domain-containing protein n=1 Tax=Macrostomum lignano TaxID=282301 RepID=A0A267F7X6_9PLAT|nr:hypothetical protein BOX15_Mlig001031g1 [Macrostomum lignano]